MDEMLENPKPFEIKVRECHKHSSINPLKTKRRLLYLNT